MDPNPLSKALMSTLRQRKQALVHDRGVGTDLPATLLTLYRGKPLGAYRIQDLRQSAEVTALTQTAVALSAADMAAFISEHYVQANDEDNDEWLGERFAAGDPAVHEAIALVLVTPEGRVSVDFDVYRYEGKTIVWQKVENPSPGLARHMAAVCRHHVLPAFEAQAQRAGPPVLGPGGHIHLLGSHRVSDTDILVHFALHNVCPCGSGRSMNDCCATRN
jgi:hypothetical protein